MRPGPRPSSQPQALRLDPTTAPRGAPLIAPSHPQRRSRPLPPACCPQRTALMHGNQRSEQKPLQGPSTRHPTTSSPPLPFRCCFRFPHHSRSSRCGREPTRLPARALPSHPPYSAFPSPRPTRRLAPCEPQLHLARAVAGGGHTLQSQAAVQREQGAGGNVDGVGMWWDRVRACTVRQKSLVG